jgi:hypothetical protein
MWQLRKTEEILPIQLDSPNSQSACVLSTDYYSTISDALIDQQVGMVYSIVKSFVISLSRWPIWPSSPDIIIHAKPLSYLVN